MIYERKGGFYVEKIKRKTLPCKLCQRTFSSRNQWNSCCSKR
ncbi:hypothetical protein [uncultured Enterococcus sp.]